jgi:hypothetical protein
VALAATSPQRSFPRGSVSATLARMPTAQKAGRIASSCVPPPKGGCMATHVGFSRTRDRKLR